MLPLRSENTNSSSGSLGIISYIKYASSGLQMHAKFGTASSLYQILQSTASSFDLRLLVGRMQVKDDELSHEFQILSLESDCC